MTLTEIERLERELATLKYQAAQLRARRHKLQTSASQSLSKIDALRTIHNLP